MRYLILIFITTSLFAARGNYLSKDVINSGDTTGKPVYRLKDKCEAHYKQECFDITSKPVHYNKVIQVDVDDTDKPIYSKENITACNGEVDCYDAIAPVCTPIINTNSFATFADEVCVEYCEDFPEHQAIVSADFTEVYCTKHIGYQKKNIDKLVEDATLKAAYDAEQAAKEQKKLDKKAAKEAAKLILSDCKKANKFDKECFQKLLEYLEL